MKRLLALLYVFILCVVCAPVEEVADPPFTHNVTFHIKHGDSKTGMLTLGLFGTIVPKTVANFVQLSTGENGYGYKDTTFHRIIDNFMIQGGDIEHKNGLGGYSIYGQRFNDENFIVKHDKPGRLSMANAGANTQGSQFFITSVVTSWLDGNHVVFGQLVDGFDFLNYLLKVKTDEKTKKPDEDVVIYAIDVTRLDVDSNANADYFDELKAHRSMTSTGIFWVIVFAGFIVVGIIGLKSRRKTLTSIRTTLSRND